jgi:hypothetical protein
MNGMDAVFSISFSASGSTLAGGRKSTALSMTRYTMSPLTDAVNRSHEEHGSGDVD